MLDISDYIDVEGGERRSIQSLIGTPIAVLGWKFLPSTYRDGNPAGQYALLEVSVNGVRYEVNTGSAIVMGQLEAVAKAKEQRGESDMGFTCIPRHAGKGVKLCSAKK